MNLTGVSQNRTRQTQPIRLGAIDSDPYNSATNFASFQDCIEKLVTDWLLPGYLNPTNWKYFNGGIIGNKSVGMNVKYASDAYWGEKIASHMYRADKYLGMKDYGKYTVAKYQKEQNYMTTI